MKSLLIGRYTHRTAISNDRILDVNETEVTFSWKDYSDNYAGKTTTLRGEEFLGLLSTSGIYFHPVLPV